MSKYQKFAFAPINPDGQIPTQPIKRKTQLSEQDLINARNEGFQQGQNSVVAQAQIKAAESLRAISHMMQMIIGKLQKEANELNEDAVLLALSAAKAISGEAVAQFEAVSLENYVKEAVTNLRNIPRIIIKTNPQTKELVEEHLKNTARDNGFEGQIEIRADEAQMRGDCAIEWQGGAIRHNQAQTIAKIEQAAKDWLSSKESVGMQLDFFDP